MNRRQSFGVGLGLLCGVVLPDKPLPGKAPADVILEVKPGANDFKIELVP